MHKLCICKVRNYVLKKRDPHKVYHGESALTIHRTPHPHEGHHQISTADLPANTQGNFISMFNTQYVKYHI